MQKIHPKFPETCPPSLLGSLELLRIKSLLYFYTISKVRMEKWLRRFANLLIVLILFFWVKE